MGHQVPATPKGPSPPGPIAGAPPVAPLTSPLPAPPGPRAGRKASSPRPPQDFPFPSPIPSRSPVLPAPQLNTIPSIIRITDARFSPIDLHSNDAYPLRTCRIRREGKRRENRSVSFFPLLRARAGQLIVRTHTAWRCAARPKRALPEPLHNRSAQDNRRPFSSRELHTRLPSGVLDPPHTPILPASTLFYF